MTGPDEVMPLRLGGCRSGGAVVHHHLVVHHGGVHHHLVMHHYLVMHHLRMSHLRVLGLGECRRGRQDSQSCYCRE